MILKLKEQYILFFYVLKSIITKNNPRSNSEMNAFYLLSLFQGINLLSVYNVCKSIFDFFDGINSSFIIFVVVFFLPPFLFNYFFLIRKQNFKSLINNILIKNTNIKTIFIGVGIYLILTSLLFGCSIYLNA